MYNGLKIKKNSDQAAQLHVQYAPTFNPANNPAEQSSRQSRGRGGKLVNQNSKSRTTSPDVQQQSQYNNSGALNDELDDVDDGVDGEEYRADTGNSTGQSGVSEIHHHVHHHYTHTHTHIHHHHEPQVDVNIFRNFDENPGQSQRAKKLKQPPANFAEIAINNSSN